MKKLFFTMLLLCPLGMLFSQNQAQILEFTRDYDKVELQRLEQVAIQKAISEKEEAIKIALENGWDITKTMPDGSYIELQKISKEGFPIYYTTFNVDAARSTRTDHLNSGGSLGLSLNGQGMVAHVWDGGIARASHQEYDGAGGTNRFSVADGSSSLNFHAAHVTGTIIASGVVANAKGMAPHSQARGYDWNSDLAEATTAAANGMLISNHSYGFRSDLVPDWWFGAYIDESRNWDNLLRNSPYYLMVVAAGNDGNTNYNSSPLGGNSSYDKLTGHSTSKNNMVVANAQDANVNSNGDLISVAINSSSSQGPTDDYRIKPDITGNGTGVYSTYHNSNTAYNSISGTSMASPNVAGSLLLLQQHYNNVNGGFMRAATLKGLALHTADDAGMAGPDAIFGWGLMNSKRAAETISNNGNTSIIDELVLNPGQTYTITVEADGSNPLLASISWTDLPGPENTGTTNATISRLVNDLDLRMSQGGSNFLPWRLTSVNSNAKIDNNVDPFERVDVANANGTYTITITHKGSLSGGAQAFSLIITGIVAEPIVCEATTPTGLSVDSVNDTSASISWDAVSGALYDVRYRLQGSPSWTTLSTSGNQITLTGLSPTSSYEVQVRSLCNSGGVSSYTGSVTFTTPETQLNYCASNGNSTADEYISRVQLGTINNASGAGTGGYSDFTGISTDLNKDQSYTITITPTWTGTVYSEGYAVWVDYNKDGVFSASELVYSQSPTTASPVSGSFTVPTSAADGQTRIRVSMKYNGIPTECESFQWGEVEDYTVNLMAATPVCNAPSDLNATNITTSSATLSWSAVAGAQEYNARLRKVGTTIWTEGTTAGTSINSTGLDSGDTYEYQVRTVCSFGNSPYSALQQFTTLLPCTMPGSLASSNVTTTSATVSWSAQVAANGYTVRYRIVGSSTWTTQSVAGTSTNLTGLSSNSTYEFQVRSECTSGSSDYSALSQFTTLTPCLVPSGLSASNITLNSATVSWSSAGGASGYDVRYRGTGTSTWTNIAVSGTSLNLAGLQSGTTYEFQVRSQCGATNSNYSGSGNFTTQTACAVPGGLSSSNIAQTTATVSWSGVTGANSYDLQLRIAGSGSAWTVNNITGTSANYTGLQAATQYEFQVRSICSNGTSAYSSSAFFTTQSTSLNYCTSQGNNATYEWIRRVRLNEIDNVTGSNGGYGNFTNLVANVQRGTSTTMNVQAGFSGTSYTQFWRVWIDLNQDGQFSATELLVSGSSRSANLLSATLNIPSTALTGQTRMRVSMKYNSAQTPCESFPFGEVEDYTVNIVNSLNAGPATFSEGTDFAQVLGNDPAIQQVELYPNPAEDIVFLRITGLDTTESVKVFTASGVMVHELRPGEDNFSINVNQFVSGMYFIRANTERGVIIERFVVR